ncbi:MAG: hypothetical protein AAFW89_11555 [Bacteroidota bacterium]
MSNKIVVMLPGTTGTTLVNSLDASIWPDAVVATAKVSKIAALALLKSRLTPSKPMGWDRKDKGYGVLANYFATELGFKTACASYFDKNWGLPSSLDSDLLIGFPYDWRQDNSSAAVTFRSFLSSVYSTYGDTYEMYLVAHSMGGILARAYLETGHNKEDAWYDNIKGLITMGTPHLGAPLALDAMLGQDLSEVSSLMTGNFATVVHDFVNDDYSDSTYELLPPDLQGLSETQFISANGNSYSMFDGLPSDVINILNEDGFNWGNLKKAQAFFDTLIYNEPPAWLPDYYCIYGITSAAVPKIPDNASTCESFTLTEDKLVDNWVEESGDHIVPKWSAVFEGRPVSDTYSPPQNVNHFDLPTSECILWKVATWLGYSPSQPDQCTSPD